MIEIAKCPVCNASQLHHHLAVRDESVSRETFQLDQCNSCGFILTNPQPENLIKYYQSNTYISHAARAKSLTDFIYFKARNYALRWKEQLLRSANPSAQTLLDYGCGAGDFLQYCSTKNWKTTGIEPSPEARVIAASKTGSQIFASHHALPDPATYDIITLWHVLEHIPDINQIIDVLKHRLANSGILFIAVPNHKSADATKYQQHWAAYDVPRHLWHFSQPTMQKLMNKHQLHVSTTIPMKLDAYYVSLLSEKYQHGGNNTLSGMISAAMNGLKSNSQASKTGEYSSLIYVIKHTAA